MAKVVRRDEWMVKVVLRDAWMVKAGCEMVRAVLAVKTALKRKVQSQACPWVLQAK